MLIGTALAVVLQVGACAAATGLPVAEGDYVAHDFRFADGHDLPALRLHYETLGTPRRDASGAIVNAAMLLHGTTGTGRQFLSEADERDLFGPGKPLDASRFYVILPDGIGAGGSAKPSDGLQARFPHYGYGDQVEAQRLLLEQGLGVKHLAVLLGTSMGGMEAWLWAERHPAMADGMVAIAATPAPIAGRNMMWRAMVIDAIKADSDFHGGLYGAEPQAWRAVLPSFTIMTGDARHLEADAPTRGAAEAEDGRLVAGGAKIDADDYLATFESSWDYDPSAALDRIAVPLLSINFADDLLNPAELGVTEAAMAQVKGGAAVLLPAGPNTFGHQTLGHPEVWGPPLAAFMARLPQR
ncbi:alpha/beta fold hydrolase [Lichenihabitans sp. Uapishka_5]|uniref:alpha/beta fold hydrolase n=1 Tax=Lichenihabitans sp. Uapishka_5 TaxID=3037302 RepID=UPI0029E7CE3F|nr:alpha/beta fold hydrolase [Lichenihabitans sp. Uapishka_5]MDX7950967.1 alpha/beta fold hydrolase [Lichenihabitans sp. Uapishka_5]